MSLLPYLPIDRYNALLHKTTLPEFTEGAVLFADISGYTRLADLLTLEMGAGRGNEELSSYLNKLYDGLVEHVHRYRGSVVNFSGDAITCWFDGDPTEAAWRAVATAFAMRSLVNTADKQQLFLKIAIASGQVRRLLVGDPNIQVMDVLAGKLLTEVAAIEKLAHQNDILVDQNTARLLQSKLTLQEWRTDDETGQRAALADQLLADAPAPGWHEVEAASPLPDAEIAPWIFPTIYERIQSGMSDFVPELRTTVPIFIGFSQLDYDKDPEAGSKLNQWVRWVQWVINHYGGLVLSLTIGDKGSYFYAAFGAPVTRQNDAERAVAAVKTLLAPPDELDWLKEIKIGLSQGRARIGFYGGRAGQVYGVLGNEVNTAARLMQATAPGTILVSQPVRAATEQFFIWETLPPLNLKGKTAPVEVFRLVAQKHSDEAWLPGSEKPLVGRRAEMERLRQSLAAVQAARSLQTVLVEGEAGIGKSRLVAEILKYVSDQNLPHLYAAADVLEQNQPYYVWASIFVRLLREVEIEAANSAAYLQDLLTSHRPELLDLLPLVNAVLPLDLPDNELTSQLTGQLRGENTRRLLLGLLTLLLNREQPTVIVLDDGHWQDTASWALAAEVGGQADLPLLFVLAFRPIAEPVPLEYGRLQNQPSSHFLKLDSLDPEEAVELVRQRLEVTTLPPVVKDLIRDKADGSPFFSEELAYVLRDRGFIKISNGECRLEKDGEFIKNWVAQNLPGSVEVIVTNRIDNLTPAQQLTIKTASVVGRTFLFRAVYDNFPVDGERTSLLSHLEKLEKLNITPLESGTPELTYLFRHAITHEVTYGLLLYAQRRRLHQAVAEWYENHYAPNLSRFYTLLAHHWLRAEVKPKALEYLEKCGEQSLQAGTYQEAVYFYEQIFSLTADVEVEPQRCAGWELNLGIAYQGLGRLNEAQPHLEKVLRLCNVNLPSGKAKEVTAILRALAQQVSYRTKVRRPPKPDKNRWLQIYTASKALVQLQEIYLHTNQLAKLLYSFNMRCNLAEQLQTPPEMAEGYFGMGMIFASMGSLKIAYKYKALAEEQLAKVTNWATLARSAENLSIYYFGIADFEESRKSAERALDYYRRLGDKRQEGINVSIVASALFFQGKYQEAFEQWSQIYKQALQVGDIQVQGWALAGQIRELAWLGKLDDAQQLLVADQNRMLNNAASASALDKAAILGPVIILSLRQADYQTAREKSDDLVEAVKGVAGRTGGFLMGYTTPLETYLTLWQKELASPAELEPKIRRVAKQLQAFGRLFPIGKFYSLYYEARYLHLKGEGAKAIAAAKKAMSLIEKLPAPYEQALGHTLLASYLPPHDQQRREHLACARRIFSDLKAKWDLAQLESH